MSDEHTGAAQAIVSVNVAPQLDTSVQAFHENIEALLKYADERTITSQDDVRVATEDLTIIASLKKEIEAKRKGYTSPLDQHLKDINSVFKTVQQPLLLADSIIRKKVIGYQTEMAQRAAEAERIANAERRLAEEKATLTGEPVEKTEAPVVRPVETTTNGELGTSGQRMIAKYEIEDFSKVPDKYKLPNDALIGKLVRAGETEIPGIRIWKEPTLVVR
jgi:hypothetical protein